MAFLIMGSDSHISAVLPSSSTKSKGLVRRIVAVALILIEREKILFDIRLIGCHRHPWIAGDTLMRFFAFGAFQEGRLVFGKLFIAILNLLWQLSQIISMVSHPVLSVTQAKKTFRDNQALS
jgi:hypothetical protein